MEAEGAVVDLRGAEARRGRAIKEARKQRAARVLGEKREEARKEAVRAEKAKQLVVEQRKKTEKLARQTFEFSLKQVHTREKRETRGGGRVRGGRGRRGGLVVREKRRENEALGLTVKFSGRVYVLVCSVCVDYSAWSYYTQHHVLLTNMVHIPLKTR
jgi:hypothetical protein